VKICGHVTIIAHYAQEREIENNFDNIRIFHKTGARILLVDILKKNSDFKIGIVFVEIIISQLNKIKNC
jgi:hypothetical protein